MTQITDYPPPTGVPAGTPPPKAGMTRGGKIAIVFILVFVASAFAASFVLADGPRGVSAGGSTHTVTYIVEGTTKQASITYKTGSGGTEQQRDIDVPLTRKSDGGRGIVLINMRRGDFLYISAQNSQDDGSVTCSIEVDGVVVKTSTSWGGYTIATCSGRLGRL